MNSDIRRLSGYKQPGQLVMNPANGVETILNDKASPFSPGQIYKKDGVSLGVILNSTFSTNPLIKPAWVEYAIFGRLTIITISFVSGLKVGDKLLDGVPTSAGAYNMVVDRIENDSTIQVSLVNGVINAVPAGGQSASAQAGLPQSDPSKPNKGDK
jgi:hypothetical protein